MGAKLASHVSGKFNIIDQYEMLSTARNRRVIIIHGSI